jgi:hypothetical protein
MPLIKTICRTFTNNKLSCVDNVSEVKYLGEGESKSEEIRTNGKGLTSEETKTVELNRL